MFTNNKVLFRFIFLFFGLIIFPFPLSYIPYINTINTWLQNTYNKLVPWVGNSIFGIEGEISMQGYGSGDTASDYLLMFIFLVVAIIGTLIWSLIERKDKDYKILNYWFIALLRYFVGSIMLAYGMMKVIKLQFPEPSFATLLQSYGDSSPMRLAWTYLGFSKGFNIFIGLGEVIGGILLFHRRTMILAGIILLSVTSNVLAVNMFFDVPVKIMSTQLLLMTIVILGAHYKRLINVIFNIKNTETYQYLRVFKKKKWHITHQSIKWGFVVFLSYTYITDNIENSYSYGVNAPKPELYGLYETVDFIRNNDTIPPLLTDTTRWRYLMIEHKAYVNFYYMDNYLSGLKTDTIDTVKKQIQLSHFRRPEEIHHFNYTQTDSTMTINGIYKCDSLKINFIRKTKEDFLLINRGFNWINEYPFNR